MFRHLLFVAGAGYVPAPARAVGQLQPQTDLLLRHTDEAWKITISAEAFLLSF